MALKGRFADPAPSGKAPATAPKTTGLSGRFSAPVEYGAAEGSFKIPAPGDAQPIDLQPGKLFDFTSANSTAPMIRSAKETHDQISADLESGKSEAQVALEISKMQNIAPADAVTLVNRTKNTLNKGETLTQTPEKDFVQKGLDFFTSLFQGSEQERDDKAFSVYQIRDTLKDRNLVDIGTKLGLDQDLQLNLPKTIDPATADPSTLKYYQDKALAKKVEEVYPTLQKVYDLPELDKLSPSFENVERNWDNYTKALGIRTIPTVKEVTSAVMTLPVVAGLVANPLTTVVGIAGWEAMSAAERGLLGGQELSQVIGEKIGASSGTQDVLDLLELFGKGKLLHGIYEKAPNVAETFLRQTSETYKLGRTITIDPVKVRSIFGKGDKISPEETQLIAELFGKEAGGDKAKMEALWKDALKNGVNIEVAPEKLINVTDRPWWAKVKEAFGVKPYEAKTTVVPQGEPKVGAEVRPERLLPEGRGPIETAPVAQPAPVEKLELPNGMNSIATTKTALETAGFTPEQVSGILTDLADKTKIAVGKTSLDSTDVFEAARTISEPKSTTEVAPFTQDVLQKTPIDIQNGFTTTQEAHDTSLKDLRATETALETKLEKAPQGSQEKKEIKIQLSETKKNIRLAETNHDTQTKAQAKSFRTVLTDEVRAKAPEITQKQVDEIVTRIAEKVVVPEQVRDHGHKAIGAIAEEFIAEHLKARAEKQLAPVGVPPIVETQAQADWQENFAPAAKERATEIAKIQEELKTAKTKDKPAIRSELKDAKKEDAAIEKDFTDKWKAEGEKESKKKPATKEEAATRYWDAKVEPAIKKGEAVILGADDMKDYFGNDYDNKRHNIYSGATNELYLRALQEVKDSTVKFTVGGTGSGKSDFLVKDAAEDFSGIIYDSTGWNYEGLKAQIEAAKAAGKEVEIYGIVPDIERARAYTFLREQSGQHPVSEAAFVKTHSGSIETMKKLIADGESVSVLDTRNVTNKEEFEAIDFSEEPLALLDSLQYSENNVKTSIKGITPENAKEIVARRPKGNGGVPRKDGSVESGGREVRKALIEQARTFDNVGDFIAAQGAPLYHGTNRIFDTFDLEKTNMARVESFGGAKAIYLSPDKEIAGQYSRAAQNQLFPRDKTLEVLRAKDPLLAEITQLLVDKGVAAVPPEMWKESLEREKENGIDYNIAHDIAETIEDSKSAQPYQGVPGFGGFDPAVNRSSTLPYTLEKKLGIKIESIKNPREVVVYLDKSAKIKDLGFIEDTHLKTEDDHVTTLASEILTKESAKAVKDGFDGVKFQTDSSIGDKPEVAIWNTDKIKTESDLNSIFKEAHKEPKKPALEVKSKIETREPTIKERTKAIREASSKRGGDAERQAKRSKTTGMEMAAVERKISGGVTPIEYMNAKRYLESNHTGKAVMVGDETGDFTRGGTLTGKVSFGRHQVEFPDGTKKFVEGEFITAPDPTRDSILDHLKTEGEKFLAGQEKTYGIEPKPIEISTPKKEVKTPTKKVTPKVEKPAPKVEPKPEVKVEKKPTEIVKKEQAPLEPVKSGGKLEKSGLAAGVEANAIQKKLTDSLGDLPQYNKANMKEQAQLAAELLSTDPERALRIAMGEESAPANIIPESVFVAVEDQAIKTGNVETLRKLATQSTLSTEATAMGQRIRALGERDADSPIRLIQEVKTAREASAKKRAGTELKVAEKETVAEIKKAIQKKAPTKQTWAEFINSVECK